MSRKSVLALLCLSIALSCLPASRASGQTSRGAMVGAVRDPSGALVPGAKITVTNRGTNISVTYVTDATGNYYVPSLLPGHYRLEADKEGFKRFVADDVLVQVSQTVRADIALELGPTAQMVEVQAPAAPLVLADEATLGQVVTNREVNELPIVGRDFTNLLKLNAGVTELQGGIAAGIRLHGYNTNFRSVSVNGARPASVSYLIDGVTNNDPLFQTASNTPPPDAIAEFKLQNGLYSAEFGQGAGQVNVALKSGTNAFHGSAWDYLENDALQPRPVSHFLSRNAAGLTAKQPLRQNVFGFTVGGPVVIPHVYRGRDRTFFFFTYQGGRKVSSSLGFAQVPTSQEAQQGNFSDWPTQLYNPLTGVPNPACTPSCPSGVSPVIRQPFVNNQILGGMIATTSKNLVKYWPSPNLTCNLPCANFVNTISATDNFDQYITRIDHNIGEANRIFGQLMWQKEVKPSPSIIPLSGTRFTQSGALGSLQWSHSFSSRTLNEARFGYNRLYYLQDFETAFGSINYWKQAGLMNLDDNGAYFALPAIGLGQGYAGIGNGGSVPFFNISNIFQWSDTLTLTRGRHTMKVGADIRRNQNVNENGFGGNGLLNFQGAFTAQNPLTPPKAGAPGTGNAFADFLLGYPNGSPPVRFTAFDQSFSRLRNSDWMPFFQDDFRVTPQLTLNLGLRWELHTPYHDKTGGGNIFDFGFAGGRRLFIDKTFVGVVQNSIFAACCAPDTLIPTDYRGWAPRFGVAWRPWKTNNRFVVRAGYGIFYGVLDNFYGTQSVTQNIPFASPVLATPTGLESQPPIDIRNMFPPPYSAGLTSFPPPYCQAPSQAVVDPQTRAITQVLNQCFDARVQGQDNKSPYSEQWGANLQYQIKPSLMVELGYQGSHDMRLPAGWSFNQAVLPPAPGNPNNSVTFRSQCPAGTYPTTCSPIEDRVPYGNFNPAITAIANIYHSTYNAMTFKVDKRFSQGLQLLSSFTWGRALDQASEIALPGGATAERAQNSHLLNLEHGPANFDQTRRLVTNWIYEIPLGKGKALLNHGGVIDRVFGGWQVNGIMTLADGTPFTVGCFCGDRSQTGDTRNASRMNVIGNPLPAGFSQTIFKRFDTSVYHTQPLGTLGTSGRNTLRSTAQTAVDFSLFKNNRLTERANLQFRAEFFNLFSSPTYFPLFPQQNGQAVNFGSLVPTGGDSGNLFNPRVIQLALRLVF